MRRSVRVSYVIFVCLFLGSSVAWAEGSSQLKSDSGTVLPIVSDTVLLVDVADPSSESIQWTGNGLVEVVDPSGTSMGNLASGGTLSPTVAGTYEVRLSTNQTSEWDLRVSSNGATQTGRVSAERWHIRTNSTGSATALTHSFYAVRISGDDVVPGVVEVRVAGLSGDDQVIMASPLGIPGYERSSTSLSGGSKVSSLPLYRLYLNAPEIGNHSWNPPSVSNVVFHGEGQQSCSIVAAGGPDGHFKFDSNTAGTYELVCDTDLDGVLEPMTHDYARFGEVSAGANAIPWNGVDRAGAPLAAGNYACSIRVNVGELHVIARDLETVYPGLRLFDVDSSGAASSLPMYWDDRVLNGSHRLPSGETALDASPTSGVASGLGTDIFNPATTEDRSGNARAWGRFSNTSAGTSSYLDTFTFKARSSPQVVSAEVMSAATDTDSDGLSDVDEECLWATNPAMADSDGDSLDDAVETLGGMQGVDTDGDGLIDALDSDDDNDTIPTAVEVADAANSVDDVDQDGILNWHDLDSDGDGFSDADELRGDFDGDGALDYLDANDVDGPDADLDNDGLINSIEWSLGTLEDAADSDNDGIGDFSETDGGVVVDTDGDGTIDALDTDSDDDGLLDSEELVIDTDSDGIVDFRDADDDNDGLSTQLEVSHALIHGNDIDVDGLVNWHDLDSDGDGKLDADELDSDDDQDSVPNYVDPDDTDGPDADFDQDGLTNRVELVIGTNVRFADSDGDGIDDATETNDGRAIDTDRDGTIDALDLDSDNDDLLDADEFGRDTDGDGIPDWRDRDDDGDGIPSSREYDDAVAFGEDLDGDGLPVWLDLDSDGDGTNDAPIGTQDTDGDGIPDYVDINELDGPRADLDGDGLININEETLGTDPTLIDTDGDGLGDAVETNGGQAVDTDRDGTIDALDLDSDGDGVPDAVEGGVHSDNDTRPDWRDTDDDNDGILTIDESAHAEQFGSDIDADGLQNWRDTDSDGDGASDTNEGVGDLDLDGVPNYVDPDDKDGPMGDLDGDGLNNGMEVELGINPNLGDSDEDGIDDKIETNNGRLIDTDGDGTLDALDLDSDGDLILDAHELLDDVDGDGTRNWRDLDSDGDGRTDREEAGDDDLETVPVDTDNDGAPDFVDLDSDDDGIFDIEESDLDDDEDGIVDWRDPADDSYYELEGSCSTGTATPPAMWLLLAFALVFARLRRWVVATAAAVTALIVLLALPAAAQEMSAAVQAEHFEPVHSDATGTLNLYNSDVVGHMQLTGGAFIHGSRNAIVVRRVTAQREYTSSRLVENMFKAELGAGLGLFGRGELGVVLPLVGYQAGSGPDVTGVGEALSPFAVGDLRVVPKLQLVDSDRAGGFGMAVAVPMYLPTGDDTQFQSDGMFRAEPRLIFDYRVGKMLIMANAGYQFRPEREIFPGFVSGPMLRWGAGFDTRLGVDWLGLIGSISGDYGTLPLLDEELADSSSYETMEALGGFNFAFENGFRATVGGGKGLSRTLGSPDYRVFASFGMGERKVPNDRDADGIADRDDKCVDEPEDLDGYQDTDGCPEADNDGDGVMDAVDDCPDMAEDIDGFNDYDGCADLDNDGDGIRDGADECPNAAGAAAQNGCPVEAEEPPPAPAEPMRDYSGTVGEPAEAPVEDDAAPEEPVEDEVADDVMDFSDDPSLQEPVGPDEEAASEEGDEDVEPHEESFPTPEELLGY